MANSIYLTTLQGKAALFWNTQGGRGEGGDG